MAAKKKKAAPKRKATTKKTTKKPANKKATTKKGSSIMPGSTKALPGIEDEFEIPQDVARRARLYTKAKEDAKRASKEKATSEANLISAMQNHKLKKVRLVINGKLKYFHDESRHRVREEEAKKVTKK